MNCSYGWARMEDIDIIAPNMKQSDVNELALWSGMSPQEGLEFSYGVSDVCWTMLVDGEPLGMGGVAPASGEGLGIAWLLSREIPQGANKSLMQFMLRDWLPEMHRLYPILGNHVSSMNDKTIRWLERCGFVKTGEVSSPRLPWPFHWMERRLD